ncbi:MAG: rod shape-determining protein RodA, partial [Prolixibacteraceae bacterium]
LVLMGWINIYASVYNEEHHSIVDISQRYGKQMIWIAAALLLAFLVLLTESSFYVLFSWIIYIFMISMLILVLFFGREINGARSWFTIGSFGFQPSEFIKFATALVLARFMSSYGFKLERFKSLIIITAIIFIPAVLVLLQNDTGSALVYFAFILVLYREGLSSVVLFFAFLATALFILSLVFSNMTVAIILPLLALTTFLVFNPKMKQFLNIGVLFVMGFLAVFIINLAVKSGLDTAGVIMYGSVASASFVLVYSLIKRWKNYVLIALIYLGSVVFSISVDYAFNNVLEPYHQARINELLGVQSDPLGTGYNVNQSKIAIGSGGAWGKGFLNGTQTKFDFVPEQSTDFIFCTVGEEWGFAGGATVIILFIALFIRIIVLAERQRSRFSRIYGYSVAVILFFHFMVNIGMTIGMMPVIGIPLPFFSYGGSSLWSFTVLLFIFIRLDASRLEHISS